MLFSLPRQMENLSQKLGLGPWFITISSIILIVIERVFMWQLETQFFVSPYTWLTYIFEASYSVSQQKIKCRSIRTREIGDVLLLDVLYVKLTQM